MSERLVDVMASDRAVSALAERRHLPADDELLELLNAWADEIDAQPLAPWLAAQTDSAPPNRMRRVRAAAALTLALTLSSSGIAAAVNGDPFAPLHYVVTKISTFGHQDDTSPVDPFAAREELLGEGVAPLSDSRQRQAEVSHRVSRGARAPTNDAPVPEVATQGVIVNRAVPAAAAQPADDSTPAPRRQPERVIDVPGHNPDGGQGPQRPGGQEPTHPRPHGEPRPPSPDNPPIPIPEKPGSTDPPSPE